MINSQTFPTAYRLFFACHMLVFVGFLYIHQIIGCLIDKLRATPLRRSARRLLPAAAFLAFLYTPNLRCPAAELRSVPAYCPPQARVFAYLYTPNIRSFAASLRSAPACPGARPVFCPPQARSFWANPYTPKMRDRAAKLRPRVLSAAAAAGA